MAAVSQQAGYMPGAPPGAPANFLVSMTGTAVSQQPVQIAPSAVRPLAMEDTDEAKFVKQVTSLNHIDRPGGLQPISSLLSAGKFDALLQPGKSKELIKAFSEIFAQNQPPPAPDMYGPNYASQVFSPAAIADHIQSCSKWNPDPSGNIERITLADKTRLVIVGDTHGQLEDVLWMFFKYGEPSPTLRYLFNGDFADRSGHSIEITLLLLALKRDNPEALYMIRGNHEDSEVNTRYGFKDECEIKCKEHGGHIFQLFCNTCWSNLPFMAHVTDGSTAPGFVILHGGIPQTGPQGPLTLDQLSKINRCYHHPGGQGAPPDAQTLFRILWSDPLADGAPPPAPGGGRGDKFTAQDTQLFCKANNLGVIVRSHEVKPEGFEACHQGMCLTIFSASNYHGQGRNKGAVFFVEPKPQGMFPFQVSQFWAPPFSCLQQWSQCAAEQRAAVIQAWEAQNGVNSPAPAAPEAAAPAPVAVAAPAPSAEAAKAVEAAVEAAPKQDEKMQALKDRAAFVQFLNERIVELKQQLYAQFKALDTNQSGTISKAKWVQVLHTEFSRVLQGLSVEDLSGELHKEWGLQNEVNYVRFLGRFQIADRLGIGKTSALKEMSDARLKIASIDARQLIRALDPNQDNQVTVQEFVDFLPLFNVDMPAYQAATTYEEFMRLMGKSELSVDDILICLASSGQDIPSPHEYEKLNQHICKLLHEKGMNEAAAFRSWDSNRDGYLSIDEIQTGLQTLLDGATHGDPSKETDLAAAAPPPVQLVQYPQASFSKLDGQTSLTMSPDQANARLLRHPDLYAGYMVFDECPNCPFFAEKGTAIQAQAGASVIMIDPKSLEAQANAVKQAAAPSETKALVQAFVSFLASPCPQSGRKRCHDVDKVNVLEFLHAIVPRAWLIRTQEVLMKDTLKRVFYCKVALMASLSRRDPSASGQISATDFEASIKEVNAALVAEGREEMSQYHVLSVCEIAAGGSLTDASGKQVLINYRQFLQSLRIVDVDANQQLA